MKTKITSAFMIMAVAAVTFLTSCEPSPGKVSFWVQNDLGGGGNITVKIDGYVNKTITGFYPSGITNCNDFPSAATYNIPPGTYNYTAVNTDSSLTWSGSTTVTENGCTTVKLTN